MVNKASVREMAYLNFPAFLRQRAYAQRINSWIEGKQQAMTQVAGQFDDGGLFTPRVVDREYTDLASRSATPWADLVVTSLAQTLYVDGIRQPNSAENMRSWQRWQRNGWDARQIPLHRAAIGHGVSYATVLPAIDPWTRERTATARGSSALRMAAFYDDDGDDEFPRFALKSEPVSGAVMGNNLGGWQVRVLDDEAMHYLSCRADGGELRDWTYISYEEHGMGVTPVVRYAGRLDLEGHATGEIAPVIPLLRRIDQDTFDRLIVQRFGAWKVRYIAGMAKPDGATSERAQAIQLRLTDLLISTDSQTKFGTLDETPTEGFIKATDHDLRMLAAVKQIPPHHLLGLSANLQAEALAAAEAGLQRKSEDFRMLNGEQHETLFRLMALAAGDYEEAQVFDAQVRWRDTESRSLQQTAQALGQMATTLEIPNEMLWSFIPGWTDGDTERAKLLASANGGAALDAIITEMLRGDDGANTV